MLRMQSTGKYSIRDLERLSGVKAHTIRIWEKRYGIIKPERTDTNIRYYSNDDLRHLLNISVLNNHGYKISAISEMSEGEIARRLSDLQVVKQDKDNYQENLLLSMIELNEAQFNKTFHSAIMNRGFEKTVVSIIFPFFERIGLMWQTGTINPAQEHFISNIIRQKIIAATDALNVIPAANAQTVLLFLPEGELHELGLLFYNYAFRARGYKAIYLGQSVPLESLQRITGICRPDLVVTAMINATQRKDYEHFTRLLAKAFPGKKIFYTGLVPSSAGIELPKHAYRVADLIAFLRLK
ncbi:DNA-binding transcriptional regulator, MerR family [Chitinophaga rupis]|uniref:DNA-binding transcriptional regulator, MerR family n=1 Tax=Chitinophaga rupis TaxID=573321 RepID=A0A1H7V319_9BACT|nr:MerR family transcriptional regulator [Chitinophaga rupis]SEM03449.1 DNA-binding transcriptional regulator, MerR family [Chitinophaga rupis]